MFEAHGVRAVIGASDADLFAAAAALLPAEATLLGPGSAPHRFALLREDGHYRVVSPWEGDQRCHDWELALAVLEGELHYHVAANAPDRISVHAGAVVHRDRAIVLPGPSLAGKTTLVAALVRAGAVYFSDEYAFLDAEGLVHPYPRPLSVRVDGEQDVKWPVERVGGVKGTRPVPLGVLALTSYRPGAQWKPQRRSQGRGVTALFSNAPSATDRPAQVLAVTHRAVAPALVFESERGEADTVAAALLEIADQGMVA
jgi:hypothetical protein